ILPRFAFKTPDRAGLPPLEKYARLQMPDGTERTVGYTEASRGCKHVCRHCPIVPVYNGLFRAVPAEVVLADIRVQVAAGARHVTFGDPDFFNGVTHALRIVRDLSREHPGLSYDATIKIEHLIDHAAALPELAATGCAFVTSAVESIDDDVLAKLRKGHTRGDFERAVGLCREARIPLVPTFVTFTPWTTRRGYVQLLDEIERFDLVEHVAPIQLAIRLLVTQGSPLLELPDMRAVAGPFNPRTLTHPWRHTEPDVDDLQRQIEALVGRRVTASRREVFEAVYNLADPANAECRRPNAEGAGSNAECPMPNAESITAVPRISRSAIPFLTEPWYC
ncbi:MAG: radical SAM protein, partial [Vicinamibacterales bacterium]